MNIQNCTTGATSCTEGKCCGVNDCPCTLNSDFSESLCLANNCDLISSCSSSIIFDTDTTCPLSLCCFQSSDDGDYSFDQCGTSPACTCLAQEDPCTSTTTTTDETSCSNLDVCGDNDADAADDETCPICNGLVLVEPSDTNNEFLLDFTLDLDDRVCESSNDDFFLTDFESTLNKYFQFIYGVCGECNNRIMIDWVNLDRDTCAAAATTTSTDGRSSRRLRRSSGGSSGTCTFCSGAGLDDNADRRRRLFDDINQNSKVRTMSRLQALGGVQNLTCPIDLCDNFGDLLDCFLENDGFNTSGRSGTIAETDEVNCSFGSESCINGDCCGVNNCSCTAIADPSESQCVKSGCDLVTACGPFPLCCVDDDQGFPLYPACEMTSACQCLKNGCEPAELCSAFDVCSDQLLPTCDDGGTCNNFVNTQTISSSSSSSSSEFQFSFEYSLSDLESCSEANIESLLFSFFQFWITNCAECGNEIIPNWLRINNMNECTITSAFLVKGDVGGTCVGQCFIPGLPIVSNDFITCRRLGRELSSSSSSSSSSFFSSSSSFEREENQHHYHHRQLINFDMISPVLCFDSSQLFNTIAELNEFQANASSSSPITLMKDCSPDSTECANGSCSYTNGCNILQESAGVSKSLCDYKQCDIDLGYYAEDDNFVNLCCEYTRDVEIPVAVYPSCGGSNNGEGSGMAPKEVCLCWSSYFSAPTLDESNICGCITANLPCCELGFFSCETFPCDSSYELAENIFSLAGGGGVGAGNRRI